MALPENYRPILLLTVGYKVQTVILLDRLKAGGAEGRLREPLSRIRPCLTITAERRRLRPAQQRRLLPRQGLVQAHRDAGAGGGGRGA